MEIPEWLEQAEGIDADTKGALSKFKTPVDLGKSYLESEKNLRQSVKLPSAESKPEEVAAFWQKLGRPEKSEGYQFKLPDGFSEKAKASLPKEFEANFKAKMHAANVPQGQAASLFSEYAKLYSDSIEAQEKDRVESHQKLQTELKGKWGNDYDKNSAFANEAASKMLSAEQIAKIKDDPAFIETFYMIGKSLSEDTVKNIQSLGNGGAMGEKEAAKKELQTMMNDFAEKKGPLFNENDPKHGETVARRTKLYEIVYGA